MPWRDAFWEFAHQLRELGLLCDVTLVVQMEGKNAQSFQAHKLLLVCASDYFKACLRENALEEQYVIDNISAKGMEGVLHFLYGQITGIEPEHYRDCLHAANVLMFPKAQDYFQKLIMTIKDQSEDKEKEKETVEVEESAIEVETSPPDLPPPVTTPPTKAAIKSPPDTPIVAGAPKRKRGRPPKKRLTETPPDVSEKESATEKVKIVETKTKTKAAIKSSTIPKMRTRSADQPSTPPVDTPRTRWHQEAVTTFVNDNTDILGDRGQSQFHTETVSQPAELQPLCQPQPQTQPQPQCQSQPQTQTQCHSQSQAQSQNQLSVVQIEGVTDGMDDEDDEDEGALAIDEEMSDDDYDDEGDDCYSEEEDEEEWHAPPSVRTRGAIAATTSSAMPGTLTKDGPVPHRNIPKSEYAADRKQKLGKFLPTCDICGKKFLRKGCIEKHKERQHANNQMRATFPCDLCDKVCHTKHDLKLHKRIHTGERPYLCNECGKSFTRKETLIEHEYTHKPDTEKPHRCSQCGKGFFKIYDLQRHFTGIHSGKKPFQCHLCGKAFPWARSLRDHLQAHQGTGRSRPFKCKDCDMTFVRRYDLNRHAITHSKDKPYVCDFCGHGFTQKGSMDKHKREFCRGRPGDYKHHTNPPGRRPNSELMPAGKNKTLKDKDNNKAEDFMPIASASQDTMDPSQSLIFYSV